jgi:uncharacterized protein with von Willebrand factor type A (vWA) domain
MRSFSVITFSIVATSMPHWLGSYWEIVSIKQVISFLSATRRSGDTNSNSPVVFQEDEIFLKAGS